MFALQDAITCIGVGLKYLRWKINYWVELTPKSILALSFSTAIFTAVQVMLQYIPRNMHTVFALLCFVVVIHWLIFPYPTGLLRWHCGNLTIAPVPAKQPWWIWINTSCEIIMNDYITTTKQSTTKPCAYLLGYTVVCQLNPLLLLWISSSLFCHLLFIQNLLYVCAWRLPTLHYIPRNMHMVLMCFALLWLCNRS